LAYPGKVVKLEGDTGIVDFGGVRKEVDFSLLDDVSVGDYVIVHAGFAIQVLDEEEALEMLEIWRKILSS